MPSTIVLSHPEQSGRLADACPEALPAAVVAGDPCYDRMLASVPYRRRYRRALGVTDGHRLIVVTSTWGPRSLLASSDDLLPRLLSELPMDEYRVAAVLHPNVWHGHGPWQVRTWLASCRHAGMTLLPPREGWRAALLAADCIVGDHGSVTFYAAALGRPVLLATFPAGDVDPASPVAQLGRAAPRLDPGRPLGAQIDRVVAEHAPARYAAITSQITSVPGESARLLRAEMYRLMELPEPATPARVTRIPEAGAERRPVTAALVTVARVEPEEVVVARHPAAVTLDTARMPTGAHLVVDETEPEERMLELGDVVFCRNPRLDRPVHEWLHETLARYPGCRLAAAESVPGECLVQLREGGTVLLAPAGSGGHDPAVYASCVYGWLAAGRTLASVPATLTVATGPTRHRVAVTLRPR